jgi:hypothetical protein
MPLEFDLPESHWSADDWKHRSPSPAHPRGVRPLELRAIVVASALRGHVVNGNTVQSESTGRRYLAAVGKFKPGELIGFDLVRDPSVGSRLQQVAGNVVPIADILEAAADVPTPMALDAE